jgi:hypothetical protein
MAATTGNGCPPEATLSCCPARASGGEWPPADDGAGLRCRFRGGAEVPATVCGDLVCCVPPNEVCTEVGCGCGAARCAHKHDELPHTWVVVQKQ